MPHYVRMDYRQIACRRSPNRAFINPERASKQAISAAMKMCSQCPVIRECARAGLYAGESLDKVVFRPAGVILAGIVCRGDAATVDGLKEIAGVKAPRYEATQPRRAVEGTPCKHCGKTLAKWTRDPSTIPEGHVMHYAGGWCVNCRRFHAEWKKQNPGTPRPGLRKEIDRKRHAPETQRLPYRSQAAQEMGIDVADTLTATQAAELAGMAPQTFSRYKDAVTHSKPSKVTYYSRRSVLAHKERHQARMATRMANRVSATDAADLFEITPASFTRIHGPKIEREKVGCSWFYHVDSLLEYGAQLERGQGNLLPR